MSRNYDYGLTFWHPETDDEICVVFESLNYFDAEDLIEPIELDGYTKGQITYIGDKDKSYYNVSLEELAQHPAYNNSLAADPKSTGI